MNIQSVIDNDLIEDESTVLRLKDHGEFGYSEGVEAERYLESIFRNAKDLSYRSSELESHIKDWSSEYHLTSKRAQLLSGFTFDRSLKVLEVGCGCGAITRFLGETFDHVVSIEGSINRARLARLRTIDLKSVSIICAPFQEIQFSQKFDIIFCIGVYEYSGSFVPGDNPYDEVLKYFSNMLTPNGKVVIAIENQFGLKYFNSIKEDHLNVSFDGLEGYHRKSQGVRTFGKVELESNVKKYFPFVQYYYPYPDYKIPNCVLSDSFMKTKQAGEIVSQMKSRDYSGSANPLWDEAATALELARNEMLDFFSNSFLLIAGRQNLEGISFDQLGIIYSSDRKSEFSTETKILEGPDKNLLVSKNSRNGQNDVTAGDLKLVNTEMPWLESHSLHTLFALNSMSEGKSLDAIFETAKDWVALLDEDSKSIDGVKYVSGEHVDSIWKNVYPIDGEYRIIDREWVWQKDIRLNVIVIRAVFDFLTQIGHASRPADELRIRSGRSLITKIANTIGIELNSTDFEQFIKLESEFQWTVFGIDKKRHATFLRWFLFDRTTLDTFRRSKHKAASIVGRVRSRLRRPIRT